MQRIIITIIALITSINVFGGQDLERLLQDVEQNNSTLKTLRESVKAEQLGNKTDIYLAGPEIGFNYLWGSPAAVGQRKDITVTQSFDIATLSGLKGKVANEANQLVEWQYKIDRMNILLETKQLYLELVYNNALLQELNKRKQHAEIIMNGQKERLDNGEGNILELNNVKLNLATVKGEIAKIETERNVVLTQLTRLNGNVPFSSNISTFDAITMPIGFNEWYAKAEMQNPILAYVRQQVELSYKQISLNKSMNYPTLSAGYMSENIVGERYDGITLGVSIPLWANKNKVKQAKTEAKAAEYRLEDAKLQFYSQLNILFQRIQGLRVTADAYNDALADANNSILLQKALDAGQISILNYIVEIGLYYNTISQSLQAELDYQKAVAELMAFEL